MEREEWRQRRARPTCPEFCPESDPSIMPARLTRSPPSTPSLTRLLLTRLKAQLPPDAE